MWLQDSDLLKHHHAETLVEQALRVRLLPGSGEARQRLWTPNQHSHRCAWQSDLAEWFEKKKRGRYCLVQFYARDDGMRFVVGHGDPARREGCVCGHRHGREFYRPERHDLVIYRPRTGELQVHAGTQAETRTYSKLFGRHLFGNDTHFPSALKYTLDPLRTDGEKALVCSDVDGLDGVRLTRVRYQLSGRHGECETHTSDDVFAAMREHHETIPDEAQITEASFEMDFTRLEHAEDRVGRAIRRGRLRARERLRARRRAG